MGDSPSCTSLASASSAGRGIGSPVRVVRAASPPEQWTLVKELNMEKRDPCEIWRSGVNHQLYKMKQQLSSCGNVIQQLERDIEQERKVITSSRQLAFGENSCSSLTSKHTTN